MMKKALDAELVTNYIEGNEKCLEILISRHKARIYNFIYSKVYDRDLTEDIFQDTFIKVINTLKKGKYNEQGKFLPWVMRIAGNLVIDHFRKNKRLPKFESTRYADFDIFSVLSDSTKTAENQMITDQINLDVKRLLDELAVDQREVIIMRLYKDMSFKEIANETGVSINTALGRMRYAIINLRKLISEKNIILTE